MKYNFGDLVVVDEKYSGWKDKKLLVIRTCGSFESKYRLVDVIDASSGKPARFFEHDLKLIAKMEST